MGAAVHWAKSGGRAAKDESSILEDAAVFGIDLSGVEIQREPTEFEVMEENWDTILVFVNLVTQWNTEILAMTGDRVWYGIPATEIEATIRLLGFSKDARTIFSGIRIMESEALPILNTRKSR